MKIPDHLQPKNEQEDVKLPVETSQVRSLTPENINRAFETLGMGRVAGGQVQALRDLGIFARGIGILETMQGTVLLTQQGITQAIAKITEKLEEGGLSKKEIVEFSKALGYLGGQLAKVNSSAIKNESTVVENRIESDKKRRSSFAPGRAVGPVIDVIQK